VLTQVASTEHWEVFRPNWSLCAQVKCTQVTHLGLLSESHWRKCLWESAGVSLSWTKRFLAKHLFINGPGIDLRQNPILTNETQFTATGLRRISLCLGGWCAYHHLTPDSVRHLAFVTPVVLSDSMLCNECSAEIEALPRRDRENLCDQWTTKSHVNPKSWRRCEPLKETGLCSATKNVGHVSVPGEAGFHLWFDSYATVVGQFLPAGGKDRLPDLAKTSFYENYLLYCGGLIPEMKAMWPDLWGFTDQEIRESLQCKRKTFDNLWSKLVSPRWTSKSKSKFAQCTVCHDFTERINKVCLWQMGTICSTNETSTGDQSIFKRSAR